MSAILATRLIPAHAGKTLPPWGVYVSVRAHPRSRGENDDDHLHIPSVAGSSPLTRGKLLRFGADRFTCGLIPAHAGKTVGGEESHLADGAHPRSRGENAFYGAACDDDRGSSPLTRGKPPGRGTRRRVGRLIPAHAGKTRWPGLSPREGGAHPRSRGENTWDKDKATKAGGSSPLTRGKPGFGGFGR